MRDGSRLRLTGEPRSPIDPDPNVCRFYGRCPRGTDACKTAMPALRPFGDRRVACHFAEDFCRKRGSHHEAQSRSQVEAGAKARRHRRPWSPPSAQALGLTLDPSWQAGVKFNLQLILRHAALVDEFPLPDDAEPAPIFHA